MTPDLSALDPEHHARYLLAAADAKDPAALLATYIAAWPASTARSLDTLTAASFALSDTEAAAAEEETASNERHWALLLANRRRVEAARHAQHMALRDAYGAGIAAHALATHTGLSISTVNKLVAGAREKQR